MIEERENNRITTESQLFRTGVHSIVSKEARTQFSKMTKQLNVTTTARDGMFDEEE